jgi:hypothetical protein
MNEMIIDTGFLVCKGAAGSDAFGVHWSRGRRHLDAPCLLVCAVSPRHGWAYACWADDGKLMTRTVRGS